MRTTTVSLFAVSLAILAPAIVFAGSQTFATPGTYTFTVPSYKTLTVDVYAGGGGGGGAGRYSGSGNYCFSYMGPGGDGENGGDSWFYPSVSAQGGGGGGGGLGGALGYSGNGTGGTVISGGGASGGSGSVGTFCLAWWYAPGAAGGAGGHTYRTFNSGELSPGTPITIIVGGGGSGGSSFTSGGHWVTTPPGSPGTPGSVAISWIAQACTTPPESVAGGYGFSLFANVLNRWLNSFGYSYCISNASGLNYFIPAHTQSELQSFLSAIPRLTGVTTSTP